MERVQFGQSANSLDFYPLLGWARDSLRLHWLAIVAGLIAAKLVAFYWDQVLFWPKFGIRAQVRLVPVLGELWELVSGCSLQKSVERVKKYGKVYGCSSFGHKRVVVADLELIEQIAVKDFHLFPDHNGGNFANKYHSGSLLWLKGDHWRRVRALLSPTFTSGKMRRMFKLLDSCTGDLVENFRERYIRARRDGLACALVDLPEVYDSYTIDAITTCFYGIKLKRQQQIDVRKLKSRSKQKGAPNSRDNFAQLAKAVLDFRLARLLPILLLPKCILQLLNFTWISEQDMEPLVERVQKMIHLRRESSRLASGGTAGQAVKQEDFLQLLVDASLDDKLELGELDQLENHHAVTSSHSLQQDLETMKAAAERKTVSRSEGGKGVAQTSSTSLSDFEILCQAVLFLAAGSETSRSLLASATYFLAHNPQVQERLVAELQAIVQHEQSPVGEQLVFDYDSLTSCQYLDAVISETLRIFPPSLGTDRECKQDYAVPKYKLTIPKGVQVWLSTCSLHMDPNYWQEPTKFDPDRFMPGRRENIVPGSYAPFSMGPRHCIGMRFSLTESKLALAKVLMHFKLEPAPGTRYPPQSRGFSVLCQISNCKVRVLLRDD